MIDRFAGEYRWLSNFWFVDVEFGGLVFPTVEHAYQAAKTTVESEQLRIQEAYSPGLAKKRGNQAQLRPDWEDVKLDVMRYLLEQKFMDPQLRHMLLNTNDQELVEGNVWGDTFWGVCRGKGMNHLGRLLMEIREEIRRQG